MKKKVENLIKIGITKIECLIKSTEIGIINLLKIGFILLWLCVSLIIHYILLKIEGLKVICFHYSKGYFWIRLGQNGKGFYIKNTISYPLLFSERNGYTRGIHLGKYWIGVFNQ